MSTVVIGEKGQVTIPQEIRKALKINKGDTLVVELDASGSIRMRPAVVYPLETYSEERMKEFSVADAMTEEEKVRLRRALES